MRFLKGAGSVLFAIALALAWPGANLLKDLQVVNDNQRIAIFASLIIVLALQQTYLVLPKPVGRSAVDERREVVDTFLANFHNRYLERLGNESLPTVRVSVMLLTKRARGLLGSHLKIYYWACPDNAVYPDWERKLNWKKKQGTCGWAWKSGDMSIYDSATPNYQLPADGLSEDKANALDSIKSWLGVPIRYNDTVVGVLNLDSEQNIDQTRFTDRSIYTLAVACARDIATLCYQDGVKA